MADGYNNARAARIMEILTDFRSLQLYLSNLPDAPSAQEYYLAGYAALRQCKTAAQTILQGDFAPLNGGATGSSEYEKQQLRTIIADACVRRFKCQRLYLRAHCALRWIHRRNQILGGQPENGSHGPALQQATTTMNSEISRITDAHVYQTLCDQDHAQGAAEGGPRYVNDDPSLAQILQMGG